MKFVTVDPGESTGYAIWRGTSPGTGPEFAGTAELGDFVHALGAAVGIESPNGPNIDTELLRRLRGIRHAVIEDWALYPWKMQELAWDPCRTARGIGALEYILECSSLPFTLQPAAIKEGAVAGGAEAYFLRPLHDNRHANDAIMHGVFWKHQRSATAPREPDVRGDG